MTQLFNLDRDGSVGGIAGLAECGKVVEDTGISDEVGSGEHSPSTNRGGGTDLVGTT